MDCTISFFGAAETVTGSRYLVECGDSRVLVDCGLFQGVKRLRLRNWESLPFSPASLNAVVLTHAHIDHSGYLPRLCKAGFSGPVYCTAGTADLLEILLPDSGHLQEEDAKRANRYGYSKHRPALPLYTQQQAQRSLRQLQRRPFYETFDVAAGIRAHYSRAGHIVGSACVRLEAGDTTIAFTGDVGRPGDPIMKPPDPLPQADVLVTESTYGNRLHTSEAIHDALAETINDTVARGGAIIVPAFAVGRAQHLLHVFAELRASQRVPDIPAFLDSPMAINATKLFCRHGEDHRLSDDACMAMCSAARYTSSPEESKAIDRGSGPMLVISASGMATGGRVLHHLRRFLPSENNTILIVGHQAAGTRGRALVDGVESVKIHGQYVTVRARVRQIGALSAHAAYHELETWFRDSAVAPRRVFVTHGEPGACDAFRRRLVDSFAWDAIVPADGSKWSL